MAHGPGGPIAHGPGRPIANSHGGSATNLSVTGPRLRVVGTFDVPGVQTTAAPQSAVETGSGAPWIGYRRRTGVPPVAVGKRPLARRPVRRLSGSASGGCR